MNQKLHGIGTKDFRSFWNVNVEGVGRYVYRSRHVTSSEVRKQFKKNGFKIISISAVKRK